MLLGADAENGPFRASNDFASITTESVSKEVQLEDLVIDDIQFKLIDTPGIFDTVRSDDEIFQDMGGLIADAVHGIQAIIFVFEAGRFTHEQESVIEKIKDFLGESSLQHMIFAVSKCTRNQTSNPATLFSTFTPPLRAAIEATGGRWTVSPNPDLYEPTDDIFIDTMERLKSMIVSIPEPYTSEALERVRREHEAIIRHHEEEVERNRQLYLQAVERVAMEEAREEQRQEQGELQTQMELNNLRREMAIIEARYKESLQAQEHSAQQRDAQLQAELRRLDSEVDRLTMERDNQTDDGNFGGLLRVFGRIISTTGQVVSNTISTISSAVKSIDR
ncbi:AIG1 family-domain-containing protein [Jimgerdemannia flammicorona]|uniref:AIG1 family-domain-containing protein n=1 Tax=Jimgerdemannia flammicorona TaxID=994334 RepID=A0A433DIF8_9FUNG|nr:AIG1 family-domain-containing protein [Jimgerdemannia flammicorona]